ncbi:MAG: threonine synthase [Cyclobacteriaceae bacterium]|nr:threonine synthase [Cyclobacteriaceae bacterium]
MKFYSTNNKSLKVDLKQAVLQGLAADGGLYLPEQIPVLPHHVIKNIHSYSNQSIAYEIAKLWLSPDVPDEDIKRVVASTVFFDVPQVEIEERIFALELFHGPTLAFKDFGARFMASLLGFFSRESSREITVLVATSGDTGSAVAHGFHKVEGVRVLVLYPSGKVSEIQEKQFTTLGDNITALEIDGTFDDCQRLVKSAFNDSVLKSHLVMTSANSINMARLIPQSFYYFFAASKLSKDAGLVFSVPSGNFGNLTGGVLASKMGLPIDHFVAATNRNDVVPQYLSAGVFNPKASITTISNAMDVGNPSNFARLLDLFNNDHSAMAKFIHGYAFTDKQTRDAIQHVSQSKGYIMDPHGAIGYLGLKADNVDRNKVGIFLETAHPAKFKEVVEDILHRPIAIPDKLKELLNKEKLSIKLSKEFDDLKEFLLR